MSETAIEQAILSVLSTYSGHWKKVAFVIGRVAESMGGDLPDGEDGYQLIAQRIEALVAKGELVVQGDIKRWRYSEVRRAV